MNFVFCICFRGSPYFCLEIVLIFINSIQIFNFDYTFNCYLQCFENGLFPSALGKKSIIKNINNCIFRNICIHIN